MTSRLRLRLVDFAGWVLVVSAILVGLSVVVGFATGRGLLGAKYVMFVVGFLLFGVASLAMQPESPHEAGRDLLGGDIDALSMDETEGRVDRLVHRLPPLAEADLPLDERVSREVKLFVVSLVVLAVSAWLEFGLGVRV